MQYPYSGRQPFASAGRPSQGALGPAPAPAPTAAGLSCSQPQGLRYPSAPASATGSTRGSGRSTPDHGLTQQRSQAWTPQSRYSRQSSPVAPGSPLASGHWRFSTLGTAGGGRLNSPAPVGFGMGSSGGGSVGLPPRGMGSSGGDAFIGLQSPPVPADAVTQAAGPAPCAAEALAPKPPGAGSSYQRAPSLDRVSIGVQPPARAALTNQLGLSAAVKDFDFDAQVDSMKNAFEQSVACLRDGPNLSFTAPGAMGGQATLIANLTAQWERRFLALEQVVNNGLQIATTTAASMNQRSGKFLRLGELLEGALDRIVIDGKDLASLSQSVKTSQRDIDRLTQELDDERKERRQSSADLARQAENQVAALRERLDAGGGGGGGMVASFTAAMTSKDALALERLQSDVGRLQRELAEECTERRQLAREMAVSATDVSGLKAKADGVQDQLIRLSWDLNANRDETRKVAGEVARVWAAEISSGAALRSELRNAFDDRIRGLSQQIRGEAPSSPTNASGGGGYAGAAWLSQGADLPKSHSGSGADDSGESIESMRRGIANEIVAAVRATHGSPGDVPQEAGPQTRSSRQSTPTHWISASARRPEPIPEEDVGSGRG